MKSVEKNTPTKKVELKTVSIWESGKIFQNSVENALMTRADALCCSARSMDAGPVRAVPEILFSLISTRAPVNSFLFCGAAVVMMMMMAQ